MFNQTILLNAISSLSYLFPVVNDSATASDSITVTGGTLLSNTISLTDSATMSEVQIPSICKVIKEYVWVAAGLSSKWTGTRSIAETLTVNELLLKAFRETLTDTATASETITRSLGLSLNDDLQLHETLAARGTFVRALAELMTAVPAVSLVRTVPVLLSDSATVSESVYVKLAVILKEYLTAHETIHPAGRFTRSVAEILTAIDDIAVSRGYQHTLSETVTATDSLTALVLLLCTLNDTATLDEDVSSSRETNAVVSDSMTISESLTSRGIFSEFLEDVVSFRITITLGGLTYQCWSFSTDGLFPSLYANYKFNSFATMNGHDYGCREDGIYLLEGDDDDGTAIDTGIRVNYSTMGTHLRKRLYHAFFGLSGDSPVLKVITDSGEAEYYVVANKAHPGRGLNGVKWELILTGIDTLDFIEVTPVILSR